jgi:hypothetical protein
VQVGELALEQKMQMVVPGDVARPAGARADRPQSLFHRRQYRRVLPHAEIVVRAPNRHLGADAVIEGARVAPAVPLKIGEDAVPPLGAQHIKPLLEKAFVIHETYRGRSMLVTPPRLGAVSAE